MLASKVFYNSVRGFMSFLMNQNLLFSNVALFFSNWLYFSVTGNKAMCLEHRFMRMA